MSMAMSVLGNSTGEIRIGKKSHKHFSSSMSDLNVVSTNSDDAVSAGVRASVAGGVEKCLQLMRPICGPGVKVFITGGDARLVASMMNSSIECVPNLVLAGLALFAAESAK
jgi:pantothenate kinase type III